MRAASAEPIGPDFKKALIWSGGAHLGLALILTIRAVLFPGEPLRFENAIRVDMVALPDKAPNLPDLAAETPTKPETKPNEAKPEPAPPPAKVILPNKTAEPDHTVILKPKKPDAKEVRKNQESALKRLDAISRLEKQAHALAAAKALASAPAVKGNQISVGTSLSGLTRLDHNRYLDDIESRIRKFWNPPKFLAKSGLRVRVVLYIDRRGITLERKIVQTSGNSVFDDSAIAAIEQAQPFAPPPDSLQSILAEQGVELDLEPAVHH